MTSHRLQVVATPLQGVATLAHTRTDGNGREQINLIVLSGDLVEAVYDAFLKLDLTSTPDIVTEVWGMLLGLPVVQEATKREIEIALTYLSDEEWILLPALAEEMSA